jgi:hypothetical protein
MAKSKGKRTFETGRVPAIHGLTKTALKIEYVIPDNPPPALYANQMLVQSDGNAMYLSFYQAQPPVIFGHEAEVQKKIDDLHSLKAHLVVQVVVPQNRMADFARVISSTVDAQAQMQAKIDSNSQDSSR